MLAPLIRDMIGAELPVLEANGLSMWGYSVLLALDRSAIRTQAALAEAIGADKTRIIAILDELQQKGWIERVADPDDRRAKLVIPTPKGREVFAIAQELVPEIEQEIDELIGARRAASLRADLDRLRRA